MNATFSTYIADLGRRCPEPSRRESEVKEPVCSACGAPIMTRGNEIGRLNSLVGDVRSMPLCERLFERIDELESWERLPDGRCYVCAFLFRIVGSSNYWQGAERERQAELERRKKLLEGN